MKIKSDFITNSSSSAFVVAWPFEIKTLQDVKKYILGEGKADQVFKDLKQAKHGIKINPKNIETIDLIARELESGYLQDLGIEQSVDVGMFDNYDKFKEDFMIRHSVLKEDMTHFNTNLLWKEYHQYRMKIATKLAKKFCEQNEGNYLYFFNYGDEDGQFMSEMEHGGTFNSVPHIQVSHH